MGGTSLRGTTEQSEVNELLEDVQLLTHLFDGAIEERSGAEALALVDTLRRAAIALRASGSADAREAFGQRVAQLSADQLADVAHALTQMLHLMNVAEEQHRVRVLRARDRGQPAIGESIAAAGDKVKKYAARPDAV